MSALGGLTASVVAGTRAGRGPRSTRLRTPPSSVIARSAMSARKGLPCQSGLSSTSENPRPLMVLATITAGCPLVVSSSAVALGATGVGVEILTQLGLAALA